MHVSKLKHAFFLILKKLISVALSLVFVASQLLTAAPVKESVQVRFRINQSEADPAFRQNAAALSMADSLVNQEGFQRVLIRSTCSPDGPLSYNRYLAKARAESMAALLKEKHPDLQEKAITIEIVDEDWESLAASIRKSGQPWAQEALEIIGNGGNQMKSLLQELWVGEAWEYMTRHYFQQLRSVKMEFSVRKTGNLPVSSTETLRVTFPSGIRYVRPGFRDNNAELEKLSSWIESGANTLYIKTYASPEGSAAANTKLAKNRAAELEKYIREELGFDGEIITTSEGECWEGIADLIENSPQRDAWTEIQNIVNSILTSAQKKQELRKPANSKAWQQIRSTAEYNDLRAAFISL